MSGISEPNKIAKLKYTCYTCYKPNRKNCTIGDKIWGIMT